MEAAKIRNKRKKAHRDIVSAEKNNRTTPADISKIDLPIL